MSKGSLFHFEDVGHAKRSLDWIFSNCIMDQGIMAKAPKSLTRQDNLSHWDLETPGSTVTEVPNTWKDDWRVGGLSRKVGSHSRNRWLRMDPNPLTHLWVRSKISLSNLAIEETEAPSIKSCGGMDSILAIPFWNVVDSLVKQDWVGELQKHSVGVAYDGLKIGRWAVFSHSHLVYHFRYSYFW